MSFANAVRKNSGITYTENGAMALSTTGSSLLDLFGSVGALRGQIGRILDKLEASWGESPLYTLKLMFYARDVRGGLGERSTFRTMLKNLAEKKPDTIRHLIPLIPEYGRWDDLYTLVGTSLESDAFALIKKTLKNDVLAMELGKPVSLCAKWMKSVNSASAETVALGKKTAKALGMTDRNYRLMISKLRKQIDITERKMSASKWGEISYPSVPSIAAKNYRKAFSRHDTDRYLEFIGKVERGEEKINSGTLYPYDLMRALRLQYGGQSNFSIENDAVLEAQWNALPNYVEGGHNILVMADTSGSMTMGNPQPLWTSIGLAVYFAERNKGAYHNLFLTFSGRPNFVDIGEGSLKSKISKIPSIVENTDLEKAFDLILSTAIKNNIAKEEMPKALIIISDMQFDESVSDSSVVFYEAMTNKFHRAGYEIPHIVFWDVKNRRDSFQVKKNAPCVTLVSGHSTSTFKSVVDTIGKTPYESMMKVLSSSRYTPITLP